MPNSCAIKLKFLRIFRNFLKTKKKKILRGELHVIAVSFLGEII